MSVAWAAYRLLTPLVGALAPAARAFASAPEQSLWGERLGRVSRPDGCHAWVHAASLGEAGAVEPLARELLALRPDARLHLTANTRAGRDRLASLSLPVSLAPFDAPETVRRFFAGVRPERLIVIETELWPQWLLRAQSEQVPVVVVSARLSERSVRGYRSLGTGLRRLIAGLAGVLCQSAEDESRWLSVGAPRERTAVVGNLKDDALPREVLDRRAARAALGLSRDRPLLVLGSLRPGEVRLLVRAWKALPEALRELWQVAAIPRHARASGELRDEARRHGQAVVADGALTAGAWRWDDRAGILRSYYAAADVAFVGGSLRPYGGHNPLEPAAYGTAVVMGAHHESQAGAVEALRAHEAMWIARSEDELGAAFLELLGNERARNARGQAARETAESRRGAARRAVARLALWGLWPGD